MQPIVMRFYTLIAVLLLLATHTVAQLHHYPSKKQKDSLAQVLDAMIKNDQQYRWMISFGEFDQHKIEELRRMTSDEMLAYMVEARQGKKGMSKKQRDSLVAIQEHIDSVIFLTMLGIIRQFGYPHGYFDAGDVTTILIHSEKRIDEPMLAYLLQEVKHGCMPGMEYAVLYDGIQLRQKQPEKYYVIQHYDSVTKQSRITTPPNIDATNRFRKEVGLRKLKLR